MNNGFVEKYDHLMAQMGELGNDIPATMGGFMKLHHAACADGALDAKTKELLALAIAVAIRCEGCIVCHVHDALAQGATREEISETVGVAILMGGGPSVVYGTEAMEALEAFAVPA